MRCRVYLGCDMYSHVNILGWNLYLHVPWCFTSSHRFPIETRERAAVAAPAMKSLAVDHKESMPAGAGNLRGYEMIRG